MDVLIYSGEGVSGYLLRHVIRFLNGFLPKRRDFHLKRVGADYLIHEPFWEEKTFMLIIPGGRDVPYHKALSNKGTSRIVSFVNKGGLYLGICAGAYFACQSISFDVPGVLIEEPRDLSFFKGKAFGPLYARDEFSLLGYSGVCAVPISSDHLIGFFMYYGGCSFSTSERVPPEVATQAVYSDLEGNLPAILMVNYGKGRALLSGVHLEYDPCFLETKDPDLKKISSVLSDHNNRARAHAFLEDLMIKFTNL